MFDQLNQRPLRPGYNVPNGTRTANYAAFIQHGAVPSARLGFATDPTSADTITIGGHVFKFLTTLVAANTYTQIKRGTSAAQTLADLVKAINGTASANVVQATTQFSKTIVADALTNILRIRWADARGGNPVAGVSASIALSESLTPVASIWNCANLNVTGKSPLDSAMTVHTFAVTAQMITYGSYQLELPFTPALVSVSTTSSTGVLRSVDEAVTISSNAINFVMAGSTSPNFQAGDLVTVFAVS
jgi:hypothetical protein